MNNVSKCADKFDHSPELSNVNSEVLIQLTNNDADGLTQRDFDLEGDIDKA